MSKKHTSVVTANNSIKFLGYLLELLIGLNKNVITLFNLRILFSIDMKMNLSTLISNVILLERTLSLSVYIYIHAHTHTPML